MKKKSLIIIRGAPAAGKSMLARKLIEELKKYGKTGLLIPDEFKWVMAAHKKRDSKDFKLAFSNYSYALNNFLKAGYLVVTEDTWHTLPFKVEKIVSLGEKHNYRIYRFLLKGTWKTIEKQNTKRPMIVQKKQLRQQYDSIYSQVGKDEIVINIDNKTATEVLKEAFQHINEKN